MATRYERSPGPAAYTLPPTIGYKEHDKSRWRNPAYQMGLYLKSHKEVIGPGPKYLTRNMTRFGTPSPPKFTFNSRRTIKKAFFTPGPGSHSPEKYDNKFRKEVPPAHSMGLALPNSRDKGTIGPGPAGYNLRSKLPPGPAYSMGIKPAQRVEDRGPGPATYDVGEKFNKLKPRVASIKLTGRPTSRIQTIGPGPAHKPEYMPGRKSPRYSFGVKHGEHVGNYILPEDEACVLNQELCPS